MDRASDSGSESWGFESLRACHTKNLESLARVGLSGFFTAFLRKIEILIFSHFGVVGGGNGGGNFQAVG